MGTNHVSGTGKARELKFFTHVGYVKSQHKDDKLPLKGRDQSHMTHLKFNDANDISGTAEVTIVKFCLLCLKLVKFGRREIGEIMHCLPDEKFRLALQLSKKGCV